MGGTQRRPSERVAKLVDGYVAVTIPVYIDVDVEQTILSEQEAEEILCSAETIASGRCAYRTEAGKCDAPLDICIAVDGDAEEMLAKYEGFCVISREDALAALRVSHEGGLVHLAFRRGNGEITQLCSCRSCCWFLDKPKGCDFGEAIIESNYVGRHDRKAYVGCGNRIDRCHLTAWTPNSDGEPRLVTETCFGCGICVASCTANAISLEARPKT